jgi:DNA polymerase V
MLKIILVFNFRVNLKLCFLSFVFYNNSNDIYVFFEITYFYWMVEQGSEPKSHGKEAKSEVQIPLAVTGISAGFPSPAEDYMEEGIDLNRELIRNPAATFFGRVRGLSMKDAGISEGDVLIIDKSLEPRDGSVAVCFIDGEFTVKRLKVEQDAVYLIPANNAFKTVKISEENDFTVWGIVTYVIKKM